MKGNERNYTTAPKRYRNTRDTNNKPLLSKGKAVELVQSTFKEPAKGA